jgi:uncharacterized membrane protein YoaK (UPF0700 family)
METSTALWALTIFAAITMIGIFVTKTKGFRKYTTSLLLLVIVLFLGSFFLVLGKIESSMFANVLFAVAGFGGGLLSAKKLDEP